MRITARQIELFQMAYRHRSTRRAADALNITQPAISRAITELELEIGVQLFDRAGRKFEPTAAAHSLNKAVQRHYQGLDRVLEAAE
ncbi:MAG: LysR family transcriptional regulator, partial [Roseibium sp.]|nr:LysR family transcriptional regulator [Roseibium sp.]